MSVRIINADVFDGLAQLPDESVHCVVTSPPYFGLRDYGTAQWRGGDPDCSHSATRRGHSEHEKQASSAGTSRDKVIGGNCRLCGAQRIDCQIGIEPSFAEHLTVLVKVFREVKRVLRKDGTCWVNYGDGYCSSPPGNKKPSDSDVDGAYARRMERQLGHGESAANIYAKAKNSGFKPKDLMMMPARLAIALQEDGWWLRSDIIWHKPNPMPESCRDRPTSAHEHIFLLTKAGRYYYDADAIRETSITNDLRRPYGSEGAWVLDGRPAELRHGGEARTVPVRPTPSGIQHKQTALGQQLGGYLGAPSGSHISRNIRNVWTIATAPFPEAHFATFPAELAERCIKAGSPTGGTVLDPFGGSGTTGVVADRLGRNAVLIELNPEYAAMAKKRIENDAPMFAEVTATKPPAMVQTSIFEGVA